MKKEEGIGRKAALVSWEWHKRHGTKLLVAENVVTGSIHTKCAEVMTEEGEYSTRVLHTAPEDAGYGAVKRCRAWHLAYIDFSNFGSERFTKQSRNRGPC